MVHHICNVIKEYQDKLREMPYSPENIVSTRSLGFCSDANKTFLKFLFNNTAIGIVSAGRGINTQ
jgi:hypothetical protein